MVVQMNYTDMPKSWFIASGLESERLDDLDKMSRAAYDHKWLGHYMDEVEDSIIKPEWFDAAIDLHLNPKFERLMRPSGAVKVAHDPSGLGSDAKGLAVRHGSIITKVEARSFGDIDEGCDWAIDECIELRADWFIWDADGMGYGLKRQVSDLLAGKKVQFHSFKGSLSGSGQDNAKKKYLPVDNDEMKDRKTYDETFFNNRSQYYGTLADKFYNSYRSLVRGEYIDPSEMISIASEGCEDMAGLRSELCRIPSKSNGRGLFQIMSKADMLKLKIKSQNMGDAVMMTEWMPPVALKRDTRDYALPPSTGFRWSK
jgi:phage terminase large subunit